MSSARSIESDDPDGRGRNAAPPEPSVGVRVIPPEVWATLREHGRSFTPEVVAEQRAKFADLLGPVRAPFVMRDLAYGAHDRQRLDLHSAEPLGAGGARPMLLFVHGGGFVGGERQDPVQPFYDNVGAWAASHGWIGATMSYRRAPEHRWPAGAEDVGSALQALRAVAPRVGGDVDRIVLFGHSAGAAHVAGHLAGHGGRLAPGPAAAVLQSGIYDPVNAGEDIAEMVAVYYGDRDVSAAASLGASTVPLWLGVGEHDPLTFHRQAALVGVPRMASGHSHFSSIYSLGLDTAYPVALAEFIRTALDA